MDERLQFVARRLADGGTLQRVRDLPQDRLQDLRSLQGMWRSRVDGRSRRPYRYAHQLLFQVENYILNVKREHTVRVDISGCSKKLISHSIGSSSNSRVVRETSVLTNLNARRRRCQ